MIQLFHGDCLKIMPTIPSGSVDMILVDPPYGTTKCKWDSIIPLGEMWAEINRIAKYNAAIVIFCGQPFTSKLIMSNAKHFKYCWVWDKIAARGHLVAKKRPMAQHEDIAVFYRKKPLYNPIMTKKETPKHGNKFAASGTGIIKQTKFGGGKVIREFSYPKTILKFSRKGKAIHPTQKPLELSEYLIKTYTNPGAMVLDFCMGSGTTGVACVQSSRNFTGIEMDETYFDVAKNRIESSNHGMQ